MQPVAIAGIAGGLVGLACIYKAVFGKKGSEDVLKSELYRLLPKEGEKGYNEVTVECICNHEWPDDGEEAGRPGGKRSWLLLYGIIIDVTDYLTEHPGGVQIIYDQTRRLREWSSSANWSNLPDAAEEFEPYHSVSDMKLVAGLAGAEGERCAYVGHLVQEKSFLE
eukprot:TRINITY_DN1957_c0_g2_i2.p1 TRINITY_DN1957_c0_g2~~TRINITY_DN1957_c0_g2_i2.p1  ORF type:complete len:166 (+),score=24.25 TRINITY_DN1957_c0_g2_i2:67-564(+)